MADGTSARSSGKSPSLKRLAVTVTGRVQGVGYRFFAQEQARVQGLSGWVRNAADGDVQVEAQGEPQRLYSFCSQLERGPMLSRVEQVKMRELPLVPDERGFRISF